MNPLKFFTWHMGKHVSPKDASNIFSLLEQKIKKEDGKVMIGKYFTEISFKTYRIEYNNKLSGFEIEGDDMEVLKTLLF